MNLVVVLSWVLPIVGGCGTYLARDHRVGWVIGLGTQVMWIMLGVITGLTGLAASALWFGAIQFRNWRTFTPRVVHQPACTGCPCAATPVATRRRRVAVPDPAR
ncbi:hypothetical protein [Umezawaea sp. Da 62-37]|uniref:hypothetical protein n=1 Tax=Umezawaea sp. Da 62-37 TaxID=3075927 RepID=UPI0028F6EE7F|nr:hypothetical protein [Umezawaea sp. Da 62-37]WNV85907.1 hypothetical protein RM788_48645 [Umezawaea sp. Da 62-37]